ncbi:unnamed protein product [Clonostachys solani]|uniref:Uncharacterized protein n=1 Tax=Clonostachys solani TaxID=160281 RepID=A0A9P0EQ85_9HYPO|nr:unnamed protein product [Clonostachys solani]
MDVSPFLSTLAPEILQLVIEHTHASAHWPLAQTCKYIYLNSESILERHRKAWQEFRVASDLDPRTVINLLWSVFSQGAASIEAWHVREFEVWGDREGSNSDSWEAIWDTWHVDVDTGKRTVKGDTVPWPLSNQETNYFCDTMLKLPRFYGESRNLNDELRQVFESCRDSLPKAILLAHLPRIQALRYAQVDDELTRHSLDALSGFMYWCESAGTWLPGLQSLSKVSLHIGLDRTDDEVVPPEYLSRSADNFCALLCLPNISEVYISHVDGGLPLRDRGSLCPKDIRPSLAKTSPVQTIILDMLEYELSDRLIDFIARIPRALQALAIRFNTNNYNDLPENTERMVYELSKHQGPSLQRLCIHDDEQDEGPSSLNWRTLDELIPFEDLRVANLDWRAIEAGLDPNEKAQSRSELLERLFGIFKNALPAKMEIVAFGQFESDEPVFFKLDQISGSELGYIDDVVEAMVKSERYRNLKAVFLQGIQTQLSYLTGITLRFPKTIKAADERGIYIHVKGSKPPPGLSRNGEFVPFPRRDSMVTGRFETEDRERLHCTKRYRD